ncbi:MAG: Flp family type IVb pilin [Alphaproteobacteria bacterium]|nr:Flp family type IVb pilin [Alphaproteobacteria bacterium]
MKALISKFWKDDSGATAIEYALLAGLLSVLIIGLLTAASTQLNAIWTAIVAALTTAAGG